MRHEVPAWWKRYALALIAGLTVFAVPFLAYENFVLNHFYRFGDVLLDTGLLADLAWHKPFWLPTPPIVGGQSFYAIHVSPLLTLLSTLSWAVPVGMPQWFAIFSGTAHALAGIAVFLALRCVVGLRDGTGLAVSTGLAVLFAFNGLAMAQVRYPHFEILIASSMMLFLTAWRLGRTRLAVAALATALICREDAGLHVTAFLVVVMVLDRWRGVVRPDGHRTMVFAVVAFAYSIAALAMSHALFPGSSSFVRVYLGNPPLHGLTPPLLATRVASIMVGRAYIVLPAVLAIVWAVAARNPYIVAGYIACAPWGAVNVLAQSPLAGLLDSYYAFPFMVAAFWPLIGWSMMPSRQGRSSREVLAGFFLMTLASFSSLGFQHNPSRIPLWSGFTDRVSAAERRATDQAIAAIVRDRARLGRLAVSNGVASLSPRDFQVADVEPPFGSGPHDTVIDMGDRYNSDEMRALAARSGLSHVCTVSGTHIRVATNRNLADLVFLSPLLRDVGTGPRAY